MSAESEPLLENLRVILYHKHSTSARTLFLRHGHGGVCMPQPLPSLATVLDEEAPPPVGAAVHPASLAQALCRCLGFPPESIEIDAEFAAQVDTPGQLLPVYLARFKAMDPPREEFAGQGGRFCALTELRGGAAAEMELLRRAYQAVLGG
ncbi:hypothetical protein [Methylomagnum sp.]